MNKLAHSSRGFSMIEVMVTVVVIAFGLLGLASLLLRGLQSGATSQMRSIAVSQTHEMIERMRSNMVNVNAGSFNAVLPAGSSSDCATLLSSITDNNDSTIPIVGAPTSTPSCTGSGASYEANCWQAENNQNLPMGAGAICRSTTTNAQWYAVIVSWDENRSGATNKSFWTIFTP